MISLSVRFADRLSRRRRRGAVAILALIALVPSVALYSASMNGGQATDDRRISQDAADGLARMHAAWTARSLNFIAMNNVEATQLLTVAIGSEALVGALDELETRSYLALAFIASHGARNCPRFKLGKLVAFCFAMHARYAQPARSALGKVRSIQRRFDPAHGVKTSHKALAAIDAMNRRIVARHSQGIGEMAQDFALDYGVDAIHFADPCASAHSRGCRSVASSDGMSLPVEAGGVVARAEACLAMQSGTSLGKATFAVKGFPAGRGPLNFGGSATTPQVKPHIEQITGIGAQLQSFYNYYKRLRLMRPGSWTRYPRYVNFQYGQTNGGVNAFTMRFDGKLISLCGGATGLGFSFGMTLDAPVPEFWRLAGGAPVALRRTPADMPEEFQILAYVAKAPNQRVGTRFRDTGERTHFGYAQATVFNPDGADLFSQGWRYRITPAIRVDRPGIAGDKLLRQAPAAFRALSDALRAAEKGDGFERINAH